MGSSVVELYISIQLNSKQQGSVSTRSSGLNSTSSSFPCQTFKVCSKRSQELWVFLNCRGHNSNFRVVQVETVQKISRACRPLSRQTSESLYKKAENELLIFVLFSPLHPTTLSRSSLPLTYSPLVLSCQSLNEGQHRFPRRCHRDAQKEYGNCYFSFLPLSFFSE